MFECDYCHEMFETLGSFAGHRSGHSRRGDPIIKRVYIKKGQRVIPFEELKKDSTRRHHLIKERGHQCEVCKNETWMTKSIPLELDHIDGDPENNTKENLRVICPNCHAQTDTYKGRNVGRVKNSKRKETLLRSRYKYR